MTASGDSTSAKVCTKCGIEKHISEFNKLKAGKCGVRTQCKACLKIIAAARYAAEPEKTRVRQQAYRAANPEKVKAANTAYSIKNAEKIRAYVSTWGRANSEKIKAQKAARHAANPEKRRAWAAAYYAANRESLAIARAAWVAANLERFRDIKAAWRKANPESRLRENHRRRARKLDAGGSLSMGLSAKLMKLQKGLCPCCKQKLGDDYHLDHIIPLALGGPNTDANMQLLRATCNLQKSAKHPIDFMQSRGFLL